MSRRVIALFVLVLSILTAGNAFGDSAEVVFETPGIAEGDMARKAKGAIENLAGVTSVDTDTFKKSIRVRFDDDRLAVSQIVSALTSVGCSVSKYDKK